MRALLVAIALVLGAPLDAAAVYRCGPQTDDCPCGRANPYPCCDNGGNCTWWAWEAACCNWGQGLPGWGNANQWGPHARAQGFDVRGCGAPVAGSIGTRASGEYGHVVYTEWLNGGGGIHVTEQNCWGNYGMRTRDYNQCYFDGGFITPPGRRECNPGDTQAQGCGPCGIQRRGCGGDGRWGGWGACEGQGQCSPGQVEEHACCDCGTTRRVCNGACNWDGWTACGGPDPAGSPACATGKPGVCADGHQRCVNGCLACAAPEPTVETCDGRDNDCDGDTDEGSPKALGEARPAFAASVVDASYPRWLAPGSSDEAWIAFRNEGSATWKAHEVSLRADAPATGHTSRLAPTRGWPAYDTAAVLDHDVAPGAVVLVKFPIETDASGDVSETFTLVAPDGRGIACPEATLQLAIATVGAGPAPEARSAVRPLVQAPAAEGCATSGTASIGALLVAALVAPRRRRA